jgi:hypothetical protein
MILIIPNLGHDEVGMVDPLVGIWDARVAWLEKCLLVEGGHPTRQCHHDEPTSTCHGF